MESARASCESALKLSLYNNRPIYSTYFRPGNTRLPCTSSLARGNTHFPRTWCLARGKHPHSAHRSLARRQHPRQPQGFGSPPYQPAWPQETPYMTVDVFPVVSVPFYPIQCNIIYILFASSTHKNIHLLHINNIFYAIIDDAGGI